MHCRIFSRPLRGCGFTTFCALAPLCLLRWHFRLLERRKLFLQTVCSAECHLAEVSISPSFGSRTFSGVTEHQHDCCTERPLILTGLQRSGVLGVCKWWRYDICRVVEKKKMVEIPRFVDARALRMSEQFKHHRALRWIERCCWRHLLGNNYQIN